MYTDPTHLKVSDPGKLEGNTVFTYLDAFCNMCIRDSPRYGNFISDMADNPAQMKDIGFSLGTEIKKLNLNVSASYNNRCV